MFDHVGFGVTSLAESKGFFLEALRPPGGRSGDGGPLRGRNGAAKDDGAPGFRRHYHASYYGAFVIGPDGHNIEAVCHKPEAGG